MPIQDFHPDEQYDAVISGLPLAVFPVPVTQEIHQKYLDLTKPNGSISYFAYRVAIVVSRYLCNGGEPETGTSSYERELFNQRYGKESAFTWWNVPPATAIHCSPIVNSTPFVV
jgi:phosphatidylethanolamine/phosphatidyl-N-methylethanolamine N-methyltransferase